MRKTLMLGLAALSLTAMAGAASAQPNPYGDRDRDGVPNAVDQRNNNAGPYGDRDRDGRPNVSDPYNDNRGGDRDGDGRPNGWDNRDDRWDSHWGREVRAPRHWGNRRGWNRHVRACYARYRTYNARTDLYIVRRGVYARCRL